MARVVKSLSRAPVRRGAQGSVTRLPSGSLRVKIYAGPHPVTGRPQYIGETVAAGPLAREQTEEACRRLLGEVRRGRRLHSHATVDDLLNRHLAMAHGSEHTRQSQTQMAAKHLRPFIGHLPLRSVNLIFAKWPTRSITTDGAGTSHEDNDRGNYPDRTPTSKQRRTYELQDLSLHHGFTSCPAGRTG